MLDDALAEVGRLSLSGVGAGGVHGIVPSPDGGYVLAGSTAANASGDVDIYLLKLAGSLDSILWSRAYGGAGVDEALGLAVTAAGGYVITGATEQDGAVDVAIIQTDGEGNLLLDQATGEDGADTGYAITESGAGGVGVAGASGVGGSHERALLIRIEPASSEP